MKSDTALSWFSAFKPSWKAAFRVDRTQITAGRAIRGSIGFVLPLVIGVATGHVVEGVSLAGGAASLGAVGLTYAYRARTRTLLLACAGIAFSAFVGSITSRIDWLAILIVGVWGVGAGLLAAIGQPEMTLGLQSVVALVVLSHFALDPVHAMLQALLMFVGAFFQALLAIIPLPGQRTAPERAALAEVYQKLADYIDRTTEGEQRGREVNNALLKAHTTLLGSNIQSQQGKIFFGLMEHAERIRLITLILTRLRDNMSQETEAQRESVGYLELILQLCAGELRKIATDLTFKRLFAGRDRPYEQFKQALTALRRKDAAWANEEAIQHIVTYCDVLRDQLHAARKLARSWRYQRKSHVTSIRVPERDDPGLWDAWTTLRANFTFRSAYFRHGIRLGVVLAVATALYRITPLPIERGYWVPLTVVLVLRPDFSSTLTRGTARLVGTVLGAVLTTGLIVLLGSNKEVLVLLDAAAAYLAFSFLYANYAIFSAFVTMEVVFLLALVEPQPLPAAEYRAIDTIIGGVLAFGAYMLWPTWEHPQVLDQIAERLEAVRSYVVTVLQVYATVMPYDSLKLETLHMDARLARSNAETAVQHARQELELRRLTDIDIDLAEGLLGAAQMVMQKALELEGYLVDNPARHALPQTTAFSKAVDEAFSILITSVRTRQAITTFPDLQGALRAMERTGKATGTLRRAARRDLQFVLSAARVIVRNLNAMRQLLAVRLREEEVA